MNCCICRKNNPDGERWIYVTGGMAVCSVECELRRTINYERYLLRYLFNKGIKS